MNMIRIILLSLIVIATAAASPAAKTSAPGNGPAHNDEPEWAELFGGAPLPVVWHSLAASGERITVALKDQQLKGVADWAETVHLAAHALMDQVKVPEADRQQRLNAALRQAAKLADEVLDGAQHEDRQATSAAYRRLASALTLIKSRLPKDITEAAVREADLRFAKAGEHGHEH